MLRLFGRYLGAVRGNKSPDPVTPEDVEVVRGKDEGSALVSLDGGEGAHCPACKVGVLVKTRALPPRRT